MRGITDLRNYQTPMVSRVFKHRKLLLALDMGLGKTVIVLSAIQDLIDCFEVKKVLVVAPSRVAKETWPSEFGDWSHLSRLRYSVVLGKPAQREKALAKDADVYIINRENFSWLCQKYAPDFPFDMLVWDESSTLREAKKKTGKGVLSRFGWLNRVARLPTLDRLLLLSGTATPEGIQGLWGQIYVLDQGKRLGKSKNSFFKRFFKNEGWNFPDYKPLPGAREEILQLCSDLVVGLLSTDVLKLPDRIDNLVHFDLPPAARSIYNEMRKELIAEISGTDVVSKSAAVLTNKLNQIASGQVYDDERNVKIVHTAKMEAFNGIVEQAESENLLVFYSYQHELERLREAYPEAVVLNDDDTAVKRWNEGKIKMLLAHPASAGHGLNLQFGGRIAIWYSLPWSLEQYEQANKRLHRSGQKSTSVVIYHLLARRTVNELLFQALKGKEADAGSVIRRICELTKAD